MAQQIPEFEKKIHIDSSGNIFVHKDMPVYLSLVPGSNQGKKHLLPSSSQHANPMHFNGHGMHFITYNDPETGKKTDYPVFADGKPPESEINLLYGQIMRFENKLFCEDSVVIDINAQDQHSGVQKSYYSFNGKDYNPFTHHIHVNNKNQEHFYYFSVDNVGNTEEPKMVTFVYDLNRVVELENIYFALNSHSLDQDAKNNLDELIRWLIEYPGVGVELRSHTDIRGSYEYNIQLSERRAIATKNYLISKGISSDRLEAKGFGSTMIINHCKEGVDCSEEEHRENRRTEFRLLLLDEN